MTTEEREDTAVLVALMTAAMTARQREEVAAAWREYLARKEAK